MRILLTNDDGIYAKGIEALYLALTPNTTSPWWPRKRTECGGACHYLARPPAGRDRLSQWELFGYALNGTPADCVKIALTELMKPPPEVVVSGINLGANIGVNVIYSGTVSAATEAAVFGVPAVAMSIDSFKPVDFSAATGFVQRLLRVIAQEGLPEGVSLNVNVPSVPAEEVRGVRITHQGRKKHLERYDRRLDPRGHVYYWLCNSTFTRDTDPRPTPSRSRRTTSPSPRSSTT